MGAYEYRDEAWAYDKRNGCGSQDANCIYVLDKGRIIEHGSHEELLALGGTYHKMYSLQAGAMEGE